MKAAISSLCGNGHETKSWNMDQSRVTGEEIIDVIVFPRRENDERQPLEARQSYI
jgi:hypothetical protein